MDRLALLARALGDLRDAVLITEGERNAAGTRPIIFVNRAFSEMTGFPMEEAVGSLPDITIGPETDRRALEEIQRAREVLQPIRVELLKYRKDRTTFWAELDVVPVLDDEQRCTHFLGVMRDITERRAAHARLYETERLASIGTLAAGIAHEINNPLAYLMMNLHFLEEEIPALADRIGDPAIAASLGELESALGEMRQGASRIAQIVRDIRSFSQLGASPNGLCEIPALVDRAIAVARSGFPACPAIGRRYEDALVVRGDPKRLAQVFLNVLLNALEASRGGEEARIEVRARRSDDWIFVDVTDEGDGIPPEVLPRVFDPFFTTKPAGKGTGLGLSVAHAIVRGLGGRMTVESTAGVGTMVRIALLAASPPRPARRGGAPEEETPVSSSEGRPLRILVVDDDPLVASSIRRLLGAENDVVVRPGVESAIALLEERRDFDLVFSDLTMPGAGGAALYATIERRWPGLEKKVVILTGGACNPDGERLLAREDVARLDKPIPIPALRAIVARARGSSGS